MSFMKMKQNAEKIAEKLMDGRLSEEGVSNNRKIYVR